MTKQRFSRFNQPVPCRKCRKKTTWSDSNGYAGLNLCRECFDAANMENAHLDGHHTAPVTGCPHCANACAKCGQDDHKAEHCDAIRAYAAEMWEKASKDPFTPEVK